ncbi:hypothetical protein CC1G_06599 [Coprinopsis cinerea okayama7|uniref:Copper transport protein n=1 Tax=Coprinopsis cinerea (strain Okayama-7 / 130 / ATCC MYA-4618 / FGSC 9003) TaxID=240176 RepID=A8N2W4_COPC7|nr:hypothetical protein CC1G_06599 [Coprinopsis cinerea okayama7\|eukprot:XP_001829262.2 hypothetical protein CC1G_06599 [Coprinopsis cinerea okayama7\
MVYSGSSSPKLFTFLQRNRLVSHYHDKHQLSNATSYRNRWRKALWRCLLYWIAVILRLCYMLAAMTFNMGLLIVMATTLATTQLFIELKSSPSPQSHSFEPLPVSLENRRDSSTLLSSSRTNSITSDFSHNTTNAIKTRPRSKSKPEDIFIHPAESNIARADAMVHHLGLEERMRAEYEESGQDSGWQEGKGREVARQLLSNSGGVTSNSYSYKVGEASDSEDDDIGDPARRRLVP